MNGIPDIVRAWAGRNESWAEAILVRAQHSSPLPLGSRVYLGAGGESTGAVSMGCVEADVRERLQLLLQGQDASIAHYESAGEFAAEVGLSCGGAIDVLLRLEPRSDVWSALAAHAPDQGGLLFTRVTAPGLGLQRVYLGGQAATGSLGDAEADRQADALANDLCARAAVERVRMGDLVVLAESLAPAPGLVLVGASPITAALCRMAALAGFRVAVADPRRTYARADLFPDAQRVLHQWPEDAFGTLAVDRQWYAVILAHDPKLDIPALASALKRKCRYVGLLGSRVTQEKRRAQLAEQGFSPAELDRIHGPVGLRIGAVESAEIAVSILAQLIAERRGERLRV